MMKQLILITSLIALSVVAGVGIFIYPATAAQTSPAMPPEQFFPLAKGAVWIYAGQVRWTSNGQTIEKTVQWKMEVLEEARREDIRAYQLRGGPWDLTWYQEALQPSEYTLLQVGTGRIYKAGPQAFQRVLDPNDLLQDLVRDENLLLAFPLQANEKLCEAGNLTRTDGLYCWTVEEETAPEPAVGFASTSLTQYNLVQRTLADQTRLSFIPGTGIRRFQYLHHGSLAECDLQLTQYHAGQ